jgi:hypothetical protein
VTVGGMPSRCPKFSFTGSDFPLNKSLSNNTEENYFLGTSIISVFYVWQVQVECFGSKYAAVEWFKDSGG